MMRLALWRKKAEPPYVFPVEAKLALQVEAAVLRDREPEMWAYLSRMAAMQANALHERGNPRMAALAHAQARCLCGLHHSAAFTCGEVSAMMRPICVPPLTDQRGWKP